MVAPVRVGIAAVARRPRAGDTGPEVMLVMGLGMRGAVWRPQIDRLQRDHRVVWFDNRGTGASDPITGLPSSVEGSSARTRPHEGAGSARQVGRELRRGLAPPSRLPRLPRPWCHIAMIVRIGRMGVLLMAAVACKSSAPTATANAPAHAVESVNASSSPARSADGHAFAAEVRYQGECAPAGSRGGCYVYTFAPDGSASHILLDARLSGRYRIEGDTVLFTSSAPGATEERLALSEGGRVLAGTFRLQP